MPETGAVRVAANLTMLYPQLPFLDRFAAAAADGYDGVEFVSAEGAAPEDVVSRASEAGLPVVLMNVAIGDWTAGDRGIAALPGRHAELEDAVGASAPLVAALGVPRVNLLAGRLQEDPGPASDEAIATSVRTAAAILRPIGARVLLENVNTRDVPGYALPTPVDVARVREMVGTETVGLQLDVYHVAAMGLDPVIETRRWSSEAEHVQIADHPGRHEPGTGVVDLRAVRDELLAGGYTGWVGAEYVPQEGPGWLGTFRG